MAIANYFSKNLLAISQVLSGGSGEEFRGVLNGSIIGIAFDEGALKSEGRAALDLTIRLLCRLYPKIKFLNRTEKSGNLLEYSTELANSINSQIEIVDTTPSVMVVIGEIAIEPHQCTGPIFYIGSEGWLAKFSSKKPMGIGSSLNPLGAGFSACIAASNVFRYVFSEYLDSSRPDEEFIFSLVSLSMDEVNPGVDAPIDLGKIHLVGIGAIGNGILWSLSNCPFVKAQLVAIDPEWVEETNLQRYVLAQERHIDKHKTDLLNDLFASSLVEAILIPHDWAYYVNESDWKNETILIALDNARDRIAIQSSLPKEIINAYTDNNLIGISRHHSFGEEACLICTYMPQEEKRSYSQEVADNLNIPQHELLIRNYMFYNKYADQPLLKLISDANLIEYSRLEQFLGMPVGEFYSKVVCGGVLMELSNDEKTNQRIEAPLAFQSALAGILQTADIITTKAGYKKMSSMVTQFNPLFPIKNNQNPHNFDFEKDKTGRCICCDSDFIVSYNKKWK